MYTKKQNKSRINKRQRGGAIYSFDLNDKIGGLPSRIPLNGTADGDCPATDTKDLGFVNYGMTRPITGGGRRRSNRSGKKHRSMQHSKKNHSRSLVKGKKTRKSKTNNRK